MQKLCCVRTIQQSSASLDYLSQAYQPVSPSILGHFQWELYHNIRRRGAIDKLLSDSAKTEISNKVMDILRAYHISNWYSEPYHQNQNHAEWRYRTIKSWTNTVMNRSGAPANCWLLCLIYVCYLLNRITCTALDGKIPY